MRNAILSVFAGALAAAGAGATTPVIYRLAPASSHTQEVCVAPCACAVPPISGAMQGRWTITLVEQAPMVYTYEAAVLQWRAMIGSQHRTLSGLGQYILGGNVATVQDLILDLSLNGGPPVRFDSGAVPWVPGPPYEITIDAFTAIVGCARMSVAVRTVQTCEADLDGDGAVTFADLNQVLSNFASTGHPGLVGGDANVDGVANFMDLNIVLSQFGAGC